MNKKSVGISQQILVSNTDNRSVPSKKLPQYIASLSATFGALSIGMVLGWTSPAGPDGKDLAHLYEIQISPNEFSWIGSLATIGTAVMCIPIGIIADTIGRKYAMLMMVVPYTIGWLLIICANSVIMFYIGRFITGMSNSAFCVVAPMYTAEIADTQIRGRLGSYFQLLLTVGILLTYALGIVVDMRVLSIISAIMPIVFFAIFVFMPESPVYYLIKENEEMARKTLIKLRGAQYDIDNELQNQREILEETKKKNVPFLTLLKSKAIVKALIIGYGLMFYQQLSGVNTVIFYASDIFEKAGSTLLPSTSTVIVGFIQVIAVFVSSMIVDYIGRRKLLIASVVSMFITSFALALYFYLLHIKVDVTSITLLPLLSVCIFIIMFSLGFGPLPWMMMGEIFAPEVKGIVSSTATLLNSLLAFVVTKFYNDLKIGIDIFGVFWLFSAISATGIFFVYFLVPETKGKTLEEIQKELNGP